MSLSFLHGLVGKPKSQNGSCSLSLKRGVLVQGVPCVDRGNWEREHDIARL